MTEAAAALWLFGHPVAHSRSPAMMAAAFETLGLRASYTARDVPPEALGDAVRALRNHGNLGANVTVPHKVAVCAHLDRLAPEARAIGAVNTVVREGAALVGHNTDALGLTDALAAAGVTVRGAHVVVVGAGGAARAAVVGCALAGAGAMTVLARDPSRAEAVAALAPSLVAPLPRTAVILHCTPCGMLGGPPPSALDDLLDLSRFQADSVLMDLVYNPRRTALLGRADALGMRTVEGLGMLVHQGARALSLWFGVRAPIDVMTRALEGALSA